MKLLISITFLSLFNIAQALDSLSMAPGNVSLFNPFSVTTLRDRVPASIKNYIRTQHAKELMGKYYENSHVNYGGSNYRFEKAIQSLVQKQLKTRYQHLTKTITNTIIEEGIRHQLDPLFIMAIIQNESSFKPYARGTSGEIGLMQIMPKTGKWLATKFNMKWEGKKSLRNPTFNIKLGTAYIASLKTRYKSYGRLYMAAYNMGPRNVKKALRKRVIPRDYTKAVMKRYLYFYELLNEQPLITASL